MLTIIPGNVAASSVKPLKQFFSKIIKNPYASHFVNKAVLHQGLVLMFGNHKGKLFASVFGSTDCFFHSGAYQNVINLLYFSASFAQKPQKYAS